MNTSAFFPHGYCLQWNTPLIALYVLTDGLVALSYYSIPAALFFLAYKTRQSVPVQPLLILFGLFIAFCGGGHAIDIVSLWHPVYWLKGLWNAGTALTSVITAVVLVPRVMDFVRMPEATEKLKQEKSELLERQSLVRAVLDSTLEGIVLEGEDGETVLYNSAAQHVLGAEGVPHVGWPAHKSLDEDVVRLRNGRLVERSTREVPGYGQLFVLRDVTERRLAEEERLRLERVIQSMKQGFAIIAAPSGVIVSTNPSFDAMYGYGPGGLIGKPFVALLDGDGPAREAAHGSIREYVGREGYWDGEIAGRRADGSTFVAQSRFNVHSGGEQKLFSVIQVDVTEQKRLEAESKQFEEKMIQTAKLESVGLLAGGIAHDFNNLLTGVLGNASLIMEQLSPSSPLQRPLHDVIRASERAADLTRQLLAYSGKGRFVMDFIQINDFLEEINSLVRMTVPRNVEVRLEPGEPAFVEGDPAQLQQLLMNLVINGAEAIGEEQPGAVVVRTSIEQVAENTDDLSPGKYCRIEVEDNGAGMDEATVKRIFEPFFTTKFTGRGLGLAAATGIAHGHRGSIKVTSRQGHGSIFRVLLPVARVNEKVVPAAIAPAASPEVRHGRGTILIIDDEEPVRSAAANALQFHGYEFLQAENGRRGVELFQQHADEVAVVLLDVTMPIMNGAEALRRIREMRPGVKVILSSGFNEAETMRKFTGVALSGFLQKPYTSSQLAAKVAGALEG